MDGFDPATSFGPQVAHSYDDQLRGDESETVAFLAELATNGAALEFAIGTGRIAMPLVDAGVRVDGIELSPDMVTQLRAKPGGRDINIAMGNMATIAAPGGPYQLIYLVFNTIFNLLTQDEQVRCFENAARHLKDDGVFVVEAGVVDPHSRPIDHQYVNAEHVGKERVVLDVCQFDPVTQLLNENHVTFSQAGIRLGPIVTRLIHPSEMDLMARLAGLRLTDRWAGWYQEPFTADSRRHVSVYARA